MSGGQSLVQSLAAAGQATEAAEPAKRPLDHAASRQQHEAALSFHLLHHDQFDAFFRRRLAGVALSTNATSMVPARFQAEQPRTISAADRKRIRALADDLPALWTAMTARGTDRREIVRLLLDHVEINRDGRSEVVAVTVHWRGGTISRHRVRQRVNSYRHLHGFDALQSRMAGLDAEGRTGADIARTLNAEGFVMPRGDTFTGPTVRHLLRRLGIARRRIGPGPGIDEWWLPDLAAELNVPHSVIYRWQRSSYLVIRKRAGDQTDWIIRANAEEVQRLRRLRAFEESHRCQRPPDKLTTPVGTSTRVKPSNGSSSASKGGK